MNITFTKEKTSFVSIPSWFLETYLTKMQPQHLKVYLFLQASNQKDKSINIEAIASNLEMTQSEVQSSLQFLNQKDIINVSTTNSDHFEITFNTHEPAISMVTKEPIKNTQITKTTLSHFENKPIYTPEEIDRYMEADSSAKELLRTAENYFGRPLSFPEASTIMSLYDWLNMSLDLIYFLLEYCANNQKTDVRYIEKVAVNWCEIKITTIEEAQMQIAATKQYYNILSEAGISTSKINYNHQNMINDWLEKFSIMVIYEACKVMTLQASNPSLNYLNQILTTWHEKGVQTVEDAQAVIADYQNNKPRKPKNTNNKVSRFNNMLSRTYDYDELAKLEIAYHEKLRTGQI
ncbi:DnaD domain protein [Candidatus Epulonipiscium viviparus]|uniref:DnaD domain protein n=1 Tax=Candidatus Epulonipiscium viviparus TaxID=420336 RepID=UPI0027380F94|nr:DnaD domain protein [Candidatus Epulopiscium viviparus]